MITFWGDGSDGKMKLLGCNYYFKKACQLYSWDWVGVRQGWKS